MRTVVTFSCSNYAASKLQRGLFRPRLQGLVPSGLWSSTCPQYHFSFDGQEETELKDEGHHQLANVIAFPYQHFLLGLSEVLNRGNSLAGHLVRFPRC